MTELADTIAGLIKDNQSIKRGIGEAGSLVNRFQLHPQEVIVEDSWMQLSERGLGSSFILGHAEHGILGSIADFKRKLDSKKNGI